MEEGFVAELALRGKRSSQRMNDQRQVDLGGLVDVETAEIVLKLGCGFTRCSHAAEHVLVARVTHSSADAFEVFCVLAEANLGNRAVDLNAELLFDRTIGLYCHGQDLVEIPSLCHPAPCNGIDHTRCNAEG